MYNVIKYSVIVPVYNSERTIIPCLKSILASEREDVELIVVDDGSVDRSNEIIQRIKDKYCKAGKMTLITENNLGVSRSRNTGLAYASGEYVLFVDSDDQVTPDYFEVLDHSLSDELTIFRMESDYDVSMVKSLNHAIQIADSHEQLVFLLKAGLIHSASNKCYRRELIEKYHIRFQQNLSIGEDLMFSLEYCLHCSKIRMIDSCIYRINRSNLNSLSRGYRPNLTEQLVLLYGLLEKVVKEADISREMKSDLLRELDFYHSKAACSCLAELFKVDAYPILHQRAKIQEIGELFSKPIGGFMGYSGGVHRALNFLLRHQWIGIIYMVTCCKKSRAYKIYREMAV